MPHRALPKIHSLHAHTKHTVHRALTKKITIAKWEFNLFGFMCVTFGLVIGSYAVLSGMIPTSFGASDITENWTFTTPGNYTLSDASSLEITGSTARLKVKNYTSDASTSLLLHLDEASGNPLDSSSYTQTATAATVTYAAASLNNGGTFNGKTSQVSVPDSAALSMSQNQTLEMWTKFGTAFPANTYSQKQGLVDKGSYQLAYDQHTGKVSYELRNSAATTWTQQAGNDLNSSWDVNGKTDVTSNAVIGTDVYVGLGAAVGDAEVWKWNGTTWSMIGGDAINNSWADATFEQVAALTTVGNTLYAGLGITAGDGEVWSCDTTTNCASWTKVGGDAVNSSWPLSTYEYVYSLTTMGTDVYAGLGSTAGDAEVWKLTSGAWTKVGGDSVNSGWASVHEVVYSLRNDGTSVYAGLGNTAGDAEVWKLTSGTWSKVGGDGVNSSWADATYETVQAMYYSANTLYVGLGTTADEAEVWSCATNTGCTTWTKIGGDAVSSSWGTGYEAVYSLTMISGTLYAGLGNTAGDNEVWSYTSGTWTKIGGDAVNGGFTTTHLRVDTLIGSGTTLYAGITATGATAQVWSFASGAWTLIGGNYVNNSWGMYGLQSVETMVEHGSYLYAGTGLSTAGNALVWRYDGTNWVLVGGQGINSSWAANTYEVVQTMISFRGNLYVGLGTTAGEAEVWMYNGSSWSQIGGDSLNTSWGAGYEVVWSMANYHDTLYAGLGSSANDAEVWKYNGTSWTKVGGDSLASGWTTNIETASSMAVYNDLLYVGTGLTAGDADVWSWNDTAWAKVGGDGANSSWIASTYEEVGAMLPYNGKLYAALGLSADDAEIWEYNGTAWSLVGGDDVNNSWSAGVYERVRTMGVYNGGLWAGLGSSAGDGEVWRYMDGSWTQIGGNGLNSGWQANVIEMVSALASYHGKLYAGLGQTANADTQIWSYGNNGYLESTTATQDTAWHHLAATYDGSTMKLYLDGTLNASQATALSMPDTGQPLLIGTTYGSGETGLGQGYFNGMIDELRISSTARTSFQTTPYSTTAQTLQPTTAVRQSGVLAWDDFDHSASLDGGTIKYRLSSDQGSHWKFWSGSAWVDSTGLSEANTSAEIDTHIGTFPVGSGGFLWQAVLYGNGLQRPTLTSVGLGAAADSVAPTAPTTLQSLDVSSGSNSLTTNTWYSYGTPYFSWSGASDGGGIGVTGYYVYFGTDNTADPVTAGTLQSAATYSAASLTSGSTYYLRVKAVDGAQNSSTVWQPFIYKYDATAPVNPGVVSSSPSGYTNNNHYTFVWPSSGDAAAHDAASGLAGYQYKTGAPSGTFSNWSSTITDTSITLDEVAYQEGVNTFSLRTIDNAGNIQSASVQVNYYFAGVAPTTPNNLQASPTSNSHNSFAFSWAVPSSFAGSASDLTYCYTVNTLPSGSTCIFTPKGSTSLNADAFATQPGENKLYLVAKDETGNIAYGSYASVTFTSNTTAPGMPQNQDISDVSVKQAQSWKLALAWEAPAAGANTVANYEIWHSNGTSNYTKKASTSGIAFIDTGLTQQEHFYKIRACDNTNNCGAFTSPVSLYPDGKFTDAAVLESKPAVEGTTTKKASIKWTTDRTSDSKIAYGLAPGVYFSEEPSNPTQVVGHTVNLNNLSPGTRYYYKAKWTDEDGNTGAADEQQFTTDAAPVVTDPVAKSVTLNAAAIEFTVKGGTMVKIYYGPTEGFGGLKETPVSTATATYTTTLDGLTDGTKYYYKVNVKDAEGSEYEGSTLSFTTTARPRISEVKIQQLADSAQPSVSVTWQTNTETSSVLSYYPTSAPSESRDVVAIALVKGEHKMTITALDPQTAYTLVAKGRDRSGNEAASDPQRFTTSTDTRPPKITALKVEGSKTQGNNQQAQLVVSWNTDEPATSQVEFGEGTGTSYGQKTQADTNLTTNHLVVISSLSPAKVYHLRAISLDKAENPARSIDTVTITPKLVDSAFSLVLSNLFETFGFLKPLAGQ